MHPHHPLALSVPEELAVAPSSTRGRRGALQVNSRALNTHYYVSASYVGWTHSFRAGFRKLDTSVKGFLQAKNCHIKYQV